jgi:large subunit ribosomal protein L29
MKAAELRDMTQDELRAKLLGLKKDLFQLRMQHATNQLDNPLRIQVTRRDIARVQTILRQAELAKNA